MIYISKACRVWANREFAEEASNYLSDWGEVVSVEVPGKAFSDLEQWEISSEGIFRYRMKGESEWREVKL